MPILKPGVLCGWLSGTVSFFFFASFFFLYVFGSDGVVPQVSFVICCWVQQVPNIAILGGSQPPGGGGGRTHAPAAAASGVQTMGTLNAPDVGLQSWQMPNLQVWLAGQSLSIAHASGGWAVTVHVGQATTRFSVQHAEPPITFPTGTSEDRQAALGGLVVQ
jgi:hypothetical protein